MMQDFRYLLENDTLYGAGPRQILLVVGERGVSDVTVLRPGSPTLTSVKFQSPWYAQHLHDFFRSFAGAGALTRSELDGLLETTQAVAAPPPRVSVDGGCVTCGGEITRKPGRGRPPKYCAKCRAEQANA